MDLFTEVNWGSGDVLAQMGGDPSQDVLDFTVSVPACSLNRDAPDSPFPANSLSQMNCL